MKSGSAKDLTEGNPSKLIITFAIPLLLGNLFQQFYNLVDTLIVGHFLGLNALAGVGATGSINFLIIGFCMGVCNGFVIPVAHKFGAKEYSVMRSFVSNAIYLSIAFSVVITLAVTFLCDDILRLMNTPEEIFGYSYDYIFIIFLGIPATFMYNTLSGSIRSIGDSKMPLYLLIFSSFINIGLDYLLIAVFDFGVRGAAIATVMSQLLSALLCLLAIRFKYSILHINGPEWGINTSYMKTLCGMGLPMGLQYSITAIGSILLQTSVNSLGPVSVAAVTAANKVSIFFSCPFDAAGSALATYGGQNVGAGKLDRIGKGLRACSIMTCTYALVALTLLYFFANFLVGLFVNDASPEMLSMSREFLLITALFYIPLTFVNLLRFLIQGMGFPFLAILAGVFEMIARGLVGLFLVPNVGFIGACFASPAAWIFADIFLIIAYISVKRKLYSRMGKRQNFER